MFSSPPPPAVTSIDENLFKISYVFKFKNTGSEPLVISNAKGSCGCTVPTWPKEPVPPGGVGEIKIEFNTKGKPGRQSKRVTVTGNTVPTETFLEITGEVLIDTSIVTAGLSQFFKVVMDVIT